MAARACLVLGVGLAAALLVGCMRCDRAENFESYVGDPTTIEAIEALHDPPDVVVEVKEGPKEVGNITCGHSPVCIFLLPVVIEDLAFPVHLKNATVKTHGKLSYEAVFRHNREFFRAAAYDADVVREIQFLELTALERNVVVEVARAPLDAKGKPGKLSRTRVQSQVDLLTPYTKFLGDPQQSNRASALIEAVRVLGDDAFPLVKARLGDPKEDSEVKREFFQSACRGDPKLFEPPERGNELMRAFASGRPSAAAAFAALACFQDSEYPHIDGAVAPLTEVRPVLEATLRALDKAATTTEFLEQTQTLSLWVIDAARSKRDYGAQVKAALAAALPACGKSLRCNYLRLRFDLPLSENARAALALDAELGRSMHERLDANQEADFALLLQALAKIDPAHAANALRALYRRTQAPAPAERELLLNLYTKPLDVPARAALLGRLATSAAPERREALAWFGERLKAGAKGKPVDPDTGYLPERPSDEGVVRHAALAALGSAEDQLPLLRYVARYATCLPTDSKGAVQPGEPRPMPRCGFEPVQPLDAPAHVADMDDFAGYALGLAGCGVLDAAAVERGLQSDNKTRALCSHTAP